MRGYVVLADETGCGGDGGEVRSIGIMTSRIQAIAAIEEYLRKSGAQNEIMWHEKGKHFGSAVCGHAAANYEMFILNDIKI